MRKMKLEERQHWYYEVQQVIEKAENLRGYFQNEGCLCLDKGVFSSLDDLVDCIDNIYGELKTILDTLDKPDRLTIHGLDVVGSDRFGLNLNSVDDVIEYAVWHEETTGQRPIQVQVTQGSLQSLKQEVGGYIGVRQGNQ